MEGEGGGDGVARRERIVEGTTLEAGATPEGPEPGPRPVEHLGIDVDRDDRAHAVFGQDRFGQGPRARAQVEHQAGTKRRDLTGRPAESLLVAGDESAYRLVVEIDLDAKVAAHGMSHCR